MDDNRPKKGNDKDEFGDKNKVTIIAIIVFLIVVIIAAIFYIMSDDGVDDSGGEVVPTIEETQAPTAAPGGGATQGEKPTTSRTIKRPPTTARIPEGVHEDHEHEFHGNPIDPAQGTPDFLSKNLIRTWFSIKLDEDASWEKSFNENRNLMTERMRDEGFKKWWVGEDHNDAWKFSISPHYNSQMLSFPKMLDEEWYADDVLKYTYQVDQRLVSDKGYSNLPAFRIIVYMRYVDDKWLMNDYEIPDGYAPNMH